MQISVGILYSAQQFLSFLSRHELPAHSIGRNEIFFRLASAKHTLSLVQAVRWMEVAEHGYLRLTDSGQRIAQASSYHERLRAQLTDVVQHLSPPWVMLIPRGRYELARFAPRAVVQCFHEAGLLEDVSSEVLDWWDQAAALVRGSGSLAAIEVGRRGEKLSIDYERMRVGRAPWWQAIESNLAGYDLLSLVSRENPAPLRIEVKATTQRHDAAKFHVTRNEWEVACTSEHYVFHLWVLSPTPKLFVADATSVARHVPVDNGAGEWAEVVIPYSVFSPDAFEPPGTPSKSNGALSSLPHESP